MDFQELLLKAQPIVIETFFLSSVGWLLGFAYGIEVQMKMSEPVIEITVFILWSLTAMAYIFWLVGRINFK